MHLTPSFFEGLRSFSPLFSRPFRRFPFVFNGFCDVGNNLAPRAPGRRGGEFQW
jgi:hypothetical protein